MTASYLWKNISCKHKESSKDLKVWENLNRFSTYESCSTTVYSNLNNITHCIKIEAFSHFVPSTMAKKSPAHHLMTSMSTGLYPFQIAAAKQKQNHHCFASCCSSCSKKTDVSLSNLYSLLLRVCLTLIADGIPSDSKLSNELYIELAMEKFALSRKKVLVDRMTRELFDAEIELSIKQERLDEELGEKDESDEAEEESEDGHGNEDADYEDESFNKGYFMYISYCAWWIKDEESDWLPVRIWQVTTIGIRRRTIFLVLVFQCL